MTQPGRNDPCPCGSGRKYKHCCLNAGSSADAPSPASEVAAELKRAMSEFQFETMEEVQAFANEFMHSRNQRPLDEFQGLSTEQMQRMLSFPYEIPELLAFADRLDVTPEAPVMTLLNLLIEAIGDDGLKATATGNLPRRFCQEAAQACRGKEGFSEIAMLRGVNTEPDFFDLHVMRIVAVMAGLVRKLKGRFVLTAKARQLIKNAGACALYPPLLRVFTTKFNWTYSDLHPQLHIVQQSFAFTLYLLHRYGDVERDQSFYEDAFIQAFPMALHEIGPDHYCTPEDAVRRCYTLRSLDRFAYFFGLISLRPKRNDRRRLDLQVRRTPLLDAVVRFRVPMVVASPPTRMM